MRLHSLICWLSYSLATTASAIPASDVVVERQDGACTNGPLTRGCWSNGFSIATDFDAKAPPDGVTVTYNFEITNVTRPQPDGSGGSRLMQLVNGQYPGPTIRAKWGDTIIVNVKNSLQNNGTGIHFHGVRQYLSNQHDGVPGVTECPIAPGKSRQYKFRATQFGTSWYHSHFSAQYGDGVSGTILIEGPATSNYDEDLGVMPITDWYYTPIWTLNEVAQHSTTGPPVPDNILLNGTHVNARGGGRYATMTVKKGKKYRIRLINTSADNVFMVSMDSHPFTVMTADFVPIKPYVATQLTIGIGQRYDVVINANQTSGNYWFRVGIGSCGTNAIIGKVPMGGILHYSDAPNANPSTTGVTLRTGCWDEPTSSLDPFVPNSVPTSVMSNIGDMDLGFRQSGPPSNLIRWLIDDTPIVVDWSKPSLKTVLSGSTKISGTPNLYTMPTNGWYLWYIKSSAKVTLPHPIHLHGHDFYILDSGLGSWDGTTNGLNFDNPTRRDTSTLPPGGYLVMAFPADNPGMWVMHCHIAFHVSQGFGVQFMERRGEIQNAIGDTSSLGQTCTDWNTYWSGKHPYEQTDSGI